MRIIVALDIIGGKCVRLTKGDFSTKKIYNEDPLEVAKQIEDSGISYLHLVDLDGARNKKIENIKVLEKIAAKTKLKIDCAVFAVADGGAGAARQTVAVSDALAFPGRPDLGIPRLFHGAEPDDTSA